MSSNNSFAKYLVSIVFNGWNILIAVLVLGALFGVAYGLSKAGVFVNHYQDYEKKADGFTGSGQPDYALAIGLPVGIIAVIVAFKVWASWGKR